MKVLHVIDSLALEGAQILVSQFYAPFRARGIECQYYLLHSDNGILEQRLRTEGARIYSPLRTSVYSPLHVLALRSQLRANPYDIVHVHLFPAQLWVAVAAGLAHTSAALITTEHSTDNRRRRWWYRSVDAWMYRKYQWIASISPAATECLAAWLPGIRNRIVECLNGIDVETFAAAQPADRSAAFAAPEGAPVVLYVGRLEIKKDPDTLLRAISRVPGAIFVFAGNGSLSQRLQERAAELGIESRVRFLGRRADVPNLLKAADLYVQPSLVEGFGLAALEAMAAGLPVVASDVPGLAAVVGECGLLFPVGDDQRLAECLNRLLADAALRQQLSGAAQKRAQLFSIGRTLDSYEALYHEVLQDA